MNGIWGIRKRGILANDRTTEGMRVVYRIRGKGRMIRSGNDRKRVKKKKHVVERVGRRFESRNAIAQKSERGMGRKGVKRR